MQQKITKQAIRSILREQPTGRITVYDTELKGFIARISPKGRVTFLQRYYGEGGRDGGRETIGTMDAIPPEKARQLAKQFLNKRAAGHDPRAERERQRRQRETYRQAVRDYVDRYQIGKKGNVTASEIQRTLLREAGLRVYRDGTERVIDPAWVDRPLRELDARAIGERLEAIRDGADGEKPRPYVANRYYAYLKTFLRWAAKPDVGKIDASPMLGMERPFDGEKPREDICTDEEIGALWNAADQLSEFRAAYLRILILTGKRRRALASMKWNELDSNGIWTPVNDGHKAARNKRRHPIPLPSLALEVIRALPRVKGNEYVFVGRLAGKPLDSGPAFQQAVRDASGVNWWYPHALKHTAETRLAELGVQPHVRDLVLDHIPARGSGAGYDHHSYEHEMRDALERWQTRVLKAAGELSTTADVEQLDAHREIA